MTMLVTGFEPFGQVQVNPSALIVEHLVRTSPRGSVYEVLETRFVSAERRIRHLIRVHRPETVLCLGVAPSAAEIRLEQQATNLDDARLPDNAGYQPTETPIVADGSPTLSATLPLDRMLAALSDVGIPTVLSSDAGRFVCNHVMYAALDEIARAGLSTRCGFIHVPLCTGIGTGDDDTAVTAVSLTDLIVAVERCIAIATEGIVGAPRA